MFSEELGERSIESVRDLLVNSVEEIKTNKKLTIEINHGGEQHECYN